jgi:hypothetical protein
MVVDIRMLEYNQVLTPVKTPYIFSALCVCRKRREKRRETVWHKLREQLKLSQRRMHCSIQPPKKEVGASRQTLIYRRHGGV